MAVKHRPLLYLETSLFGFYFDSEPRNASRREAVVGMFDQVRLGILDAATSSRTVLELNLAAEPLRSKLLSLLADTRLLDVDDSEAERLAAACLREGVIPVKEVEDARHVAYATVGRADVLVSLNLRHLANEWAERNIGAVNLREGYQLISIRMPEEVLRYEG
ncbi:MAG TPA: hypothetical protein VMH22_09000 [bacterium]|nr:hypothetical protein [bacterium]